MKRAIWKYPITIIDTNRLLMPAGATPLAVQMQGNQPCLWMLVDPKAPQVTRLFMIIGTGHEVEEPFVRAEDYIGTFQWGQYVWHLFEITPR